MCNSFHVATSASAQVVPTPKQGQGFRVRVGNFLKPSRAFGPEGAKMLWWEGVHSVGGCLGPRKCETAKPKEHEGKQNCPCCLWSLPTTFFFFLKRQSTPKIKNTYFSLLLVFQLDIHPNILAMTPAVQMSAAFQYNGTKWLSLLVVLSRVPPGLQNRHCRH